MNSENEIDYSLSMNLAQELLKMGAISEEDYRNFDTKMQQKYQPKIGGLFWEIVPDKA